MYQSLRPAHSTFNVFSASNHVLTLQESAGRLENKKKGKKKKLSTHFPFLQLHTLLRKRSTQMGDGDRACGRHRVVVRFLSALEST